MESLLSELRRGDEAQQANIRALALAASPAKQGLLRMRADEAF